MEVRSSHSSELENLLVMLSPCIIFFAVYLVIFKCLPLLYCGISIQK
jgi:hypothetical protein